jgi:hypothetical protein
MSLHRTAVIYAAAQAAHEANRAWCLVNGDTSQPLWGSTPEWQSDSAIAGARAIADDPTITAEQSHEAWEVRKLAEGWTYGCTKDPERKKHPCLVPYAELPPEQRAKDAIFGAVVRAILRAGGVIPPYVAPPKPADLD